MLQPIKKSVLLVLVAQGLFFGCGAHANTNTIIQKQIARAHRIEKTQSNNVDALRLKSRRQVARYSSWVKNNAITQPSVWHQAHKPIPQALVFVSLGMPKQLLRRTLMQAHVFHLPVVIRGLKDHSFRKTIAVIFNLNKNAGHQKIGGVLIDPVWFRQFHIHTVPAVVVSHRGGTCDLQRTCSAQSFDVVRGNIPVQRALEIIAKQGQAAPDVAKDLLRTYAHV